MSPYYLKDILLAVLHGEADTQKKHWTDLWYRAIISSTILMVIQCINSSVFKREFVSWVIMQFKGKKN